MIMRVISLQALKNLLNLFPNYHSMINEDDVRHRFVSLSKSRLIVENWNAYSRHALDDNVRALNAS